MDALLVACFALMGWIICYIIYQRVFDPIYHRRPSELVEDAKAKTHSASGDTHNKLHREKKRLKDKWNYHKDTKNKD